MLEYFTGAFLRGWLWELISACVGSYFLIKVPVVRKSYRHFVYFLWFTFFVDFLGGYDALAYFTDYEVLGFIKGTVWQHDYWYYNLAKPIFFAFYFYFFIAQLDSPKLRYILKWIAIVSVGSFILDLIISGSFFNAYPSYTYVIGPIILMLYTGAYFRQLLNSQQLLYFYKELSFYVAIGVLIWHLGFTPMFLYNNYLVMKTSPDFLQIYRWMIGIFNFTLYGLFVVGFIIEIRKSRQKKKSRETLVRFD